MRGRSDAKPGDRVLVLGGGPVGKTAALLLARWGIPVTILDRRTSLDLAGSRAICQQRDVLDLWTAVGAGEEIVRRGLAWTRGRTFYRDRELFATTFPDRGRSPLPPIVNISQARVEAILETCIRRTPGIELRRGIQVDAVRQDPTGVTVSGQTESSRLEIRGAYAVACAGARSEELRAALGLGFPGRSFGDRFLVCDIRAELPEWERERQFHFDPSWNPGRQVLIHPCPESTFRIDWQVPSDYDFERERRTGGLDRRVRRIIGERPYELLWSSVYRFHSRHADRMQAGRVLVAGDTAHLVSPFGARGLNSGVADAENAAWKIACAMRGWAPAKLLATYHDERLAAAMENIEVTTASMEFLVPQDERGWRRRREVLDRALSDPAARAEIDSGRFYEPYWYVDSPLTTGSAERTFPGRPPRGESPPAVPGVLVPDAPIRVAGRPEVTRLRQIVRDGLLVLTTAGVEPAEAARTLRASVPVPSGALPLREIDVEGVLEEALGARPGEAWLIRPDGHIAAVLADPDGPLAAAARRCVGLME